MGKWLRGVDLNHRPLGYEANRKNDSIIFQRLDGAGNDRKSLKRPQSRVIGPQSDHDFSSGLPFCSGSYSASLGCYVRFPCALKCCWRCLPSSQQYPRYFLLNGLAGR